MFSKNIETIQLLYFFLFKVFFISLGKLVGYCLSPISFTKGIVKYSVHIIQWKVEVIRNIIKQSLICTRKSHLQKYFELLELAQPCKPCFLWSIQILKKYPGGPPGDPRCTFFTYGQNVIKRLVHSCAKLGVNKYFNMW